MLGVGDGIKEYSPAVDMWSIGVILFILLSGYSPFGERARHSSGECAGLQAAGPSQACTLAASSPSTSLLLRHGVHELCAASAGSSSFSFAGSLPDGVLRSARPLLPRHGGSKGCMEQLVLLAGLS